MSRAASADRDTRGRLLAAAGQLFADQGFDRVSVREICREAGANVAAVNYHFGDKAGLYRATLDAAVSAMERVTTDQKDAGRGLSAEARLRSYIRVLIEHGARDDVAWMRRLLHREMALPTAFADTFMNRGVKPRIAYLSSIVAELMGTPVDDPRVLACVASVHGQCFIAFPSPIGRRLWPGQKTPDSLAGFAEHITQFSLAGIRAAAADRARAGRGHARRT